MRDYISREDAIMVAGDMLNSLTGISCKDGENTAREYFKCIPSTDIRENVRGEWLPHPNKQNKEWDICSACGTGCKRREIGIHANGDKWVTEYNFPFCPNCGAEMHK